jgi:hypothetical protein
MRTRLLHTLVLALATTFATPAGAAKRDCSPQQKHAANMVKNKVEAKQHESEAQAAYNKALGALDAALKAAKTYEADLAKAKTNVEARTRDADACHARRKDNDCTWQDNRKKYAEEQLAKLEANPPSKTIPEAEQKLERAREELALAKERVEVAERAIKEANAALAKCQKAKA